MYTMSKCRNCVLSEMFDSYGTLDCIERRHILRSLTFGSGTSRGPSDAFTSISRNKHCPLQQRHEYASDFANARQYHEHESKTTRKL